jgi:PTS system nitrogen regulatory IIA component
LHLSALLKSGGIWRDVPANDAPAAFQRIVNALPGVPAPVRNLLGQKVGAKGGVTIAPVGGGFALPHPSTRITLGRDSGLLSLILLREPLSQIDSVVDDLPVNRLLFFIAPSPRAHLDLIGRLSRFLSQGVLHDLLDQNAKDEAIFQAFDAFDNSFISPSNPEVHS